MNDSILILAQGGMSATGAPSTAAPAAGTTAITTTPVAPPGGPAGSSPSMWPMMLPLVFLVGAMIVMQMFAGRKEKKKRAELMSSLKRGDKVLTIGGILGTIDQVRDDEIVLKVDPNSNAKIAFTRSSIQQVVTAGNSSGSAEASSNGAVEVKAKNEKAVAAR